MRLSAFAVIVACSLFACLHAQSKPPTQESVDTAKGKATQGTPGTNNTGAPAHYSQVLPITVVVQKPPDDPAAHARQEQRDERNAVAQERMANLTRALAVLAGVTLLFVGWQAWETRKAAQAASKTADGLKNAERAYIGLMHWETDDAKQNRFIGFHPDPRKDDTPTDGTARYKLEIRIVNNGRTPAHIHGGLIRYAVDLDEHPFEPPVISANDREQIDGTFLHAGSRYIRKLTYMLSPNDILMLGKKRIWMVGYVEYTDTFKVRHRAGYCRRLLPGSAGKNNLSVDKTSASYNYDREIGEDGKEK